MPGEPYQIALEMVAERTVVIRRARAQPSEGSLIRDELKERFSNEIGVAGDHTHQQLDLPLVQWRTVPLIQFYHLFRREIRRLQQLTDVKGRLILIRDQQTGFRGIHQHQIQIVPSLIEGALVVPRAKKTEELRRVGGIAENSIDFVKGKNERRFRMSKDLRFEEFSKLVGRPKSGLPVAIRPFGRLLF
jgi:hypothetical protein